jgi:HD-GYP domain-containing protein (c-di-GMP phosphodiesterase class II)
MQTKVYSTNLKIGMFVSSLDRPWLDTPFLFQGFLIQDDEDLRLLRQYCEFVHVDWNLSPLPPPASAISRPARPASSIVASDSYADADTRASAEEKSAPAGDSEAMRPKPAASEPHFTIYNQQTRSRPARASSADTGTLHGYDDRGAMDGEGLFAGLADRVMGIFSGRPKLSHTGAVHKFQHRDEEETRAKKYERPAFIPPEIQLSTYVQALPVEEEIAPAAKAHDHASDLLGNLVDDIKSNKRLVFAETEEVVQEVVGSMVRNPDAMMWVTRLRQQDETVYGHGLQVAVNMVALGRHLGLPREFLDRLCSIGLLLDIGKIKLPKELLQKKGRLTVDEFETVKSHVQIALDILKETPDLHPDVLLGIAQHHERENGSGYPAGRARNEISLFGRMAAIVDSFSALTNPRPYAETMPAYEALQCLGNYNPDLYQASMLEQLIQAIGVFPVGSMIELSTGEAAVVISHSKVRRLKPRVLIISDQNKRQSPQPATLDLLYQPQIADRSEIYILRGLPSGAFGLDTREYFL